MTILHLYLSLAVMAIMGMTLLSLIGLRAFRDWIELRRFELAHAGSGGPPTPSQRIDLADLKERIRKLEAIAAGVEF